jgi:alkylation response protein AidB-like acyl-CoA dehydrogenase
MSVTLPETAPAHVGWSEIAAGVGEEIEPLAEAYDRSGEFVHEQFRVLTEAGLLTAPVPEELGGGGASHAEACEILRVLGRSCGSTAVTLSMHYHLLCTQVWRYRHDLPAEAVLRRVADERLVLVSTGASDWLASSGTARRVEGGYRVSGRKAPSSGSPAGDVLVTSIRWDDAPGGPQVLHCSIPFADDGVSVDETWDTLGLRATGSHTVVLDDVFVPDAAVALTRPADRWHPIWNAVTGTALPLIMSAYLGIADRAVTEALEVARRKPASSHLAASVGEMQNHHAAAEDAVAAMVRNADDLRFEATDDIATYALTRKANAAEAVEQTARTAIEVAGGVGFSRSHPLERLWRDASGARFHPLPGSRQRELCGRVMLGLALEG